MKTNNRLVISSKRFVLAGIFPLFLFLLINCSSKTVDPTPANVPPVTPPV
jgi:hypothetical protein